MIFHNRVVDFVKSPKNVCSWMFSHSLGPKENRYILHHIVKLQPAWTNMRYQFFLIFFHLVKSLGPYEWENIQEQTFFELLTKSTALPYGVWAIGPCLIEASVIAGWFITTWVTGTWAFLLCSMWSNSLAIWMLAQQVQQQATMQSPQASPE